MVVCGLMTLIHWFQSGLQAWDILSSAAILDSKTVVTRNLDDEFHPHAQVKLCLPHMSKSADGEMDTRIKAQ